MAVTTMTCHHHGLVPVEGEGAAAACWGWNRLDSLQNCGAIYPELSLPGAPDQAWASSTALCQDPGRG